MAIPMPNADMVANMATYHKKNSLTLISVAIHESVTVELMMPD